MVSLDDADKNKEFAEALEAAHVLLSDPSGEVAKAYGVTAIGGLYARRWTFYIDEAGKVLYIDKDVNTETAGQDIAARLEALEIPKRMSEGGGG